MKILKVRKFVAKKEFTILFLFLYLAANVAGVSMLFTKYDFKNDELGKYLPMANSIVYDDKIQGDWKTPIFYPAVIANSQIYNKIAGNTDPESIILSIRILHILIVNLAFIFTYLLGKILFNKKMGLFSALFLTLLSYWLTENRHFLLDTAATMFVVASAYFLFLSLKTREPRHYVLSAIMIVFGLMTKFPVGIFAGSFFAIILISKEKHAHKIRALIYYSAAFLLMLIIYGSIDYFTKGQFAASLLRTILADFNTAPVGQASSSLYFVSHNFYIKSIITFIFPIFIFFLYGLYELFLKDKRLFWQSLFLLIPFPLLLTIFTWKESRYIIPVVPFFILIGIYGMHQFFKNKKPEGLASHIKQAAIIILHLLVFVIFLKQIARKLIVNLDYATGIEYNEFRLLLLSIIFSALIMLYALIYLRNFKEKKRIAIFSVLASIIVLSILPFGSFKEIAGFPPERDSCYELVRHNKDYLKNYELTAIPPCLVPRFYFDDKIRFVVPAFRGEQVLSPEHIKTISSSDYLIAPKRWEPQLINLLQDSKRAECIASTKTYCIYRIGSVPIHVTYIIIPKAEELSSNRATIMQDGRYALHHSNSAISYITSLEKANYTIAFSIKSVGPPPIETDLLIQIEDKIHNYDLRKNKSMTDWDLHIQNIGEIQGTVNFTWVFRNDTAKYDPDTDTWYDDRNVYLKDIRLLMSKQEE